MMECSDAVEDAVELVDPDFGELLRLKNLLITFAFDLVLLLELPARLLAVLMPLLVDRGSTEECKAEMLLCLARR